MGSDMIGGGSTPSPWRAWWSPEALSMAQKALEITKQDWCLTGQTLESAQLSNSQTRSWGKDSDTLTNGDSEDKRLSHPTLAELGKEAGIDAIVDNIVSLLFVRMVALVTCRLGNHQEEQFGRAGNGNDRGVARQKIYADYSTTTICKAALRPNDQSQQHQRELTRQLSEPIMNRRPRFIKSSTYGDVDDNGTNGSNSNNDSPPPYPSQITPTVVTQLRRYVSIICRQYATPDKIPYHNVEHAYHVFLSANKLLDLVLCEGAEAESSGRLYNRGGRRGRRRGEMQVERKARPTFGIKSNPLAQLSFLFAALVHDVDHTGISNQQLVLEMDDLAILYNDQSVAEQRSLAVAFRTLKGDGYENLRDVLFPRPAAHPSPGENGEARGGRKPASSAPAPHPNEDFFKFRRLVIDLVLVTDIASPERTQIVKSRWKEAFGEAIVAEKLKKGYAVSRRATVDSTGTRGSSGTRGSGGPDRRATVESIDENGELGRSPTRDTRDEKDFPTEENDGTDRRPSDGDGEDAGSAAPSSSRMHMKRGNSQGSMGSGSSRGTGCSRTRRAGRGPGMARGASVKSMKSQRSQRSNMTTESMGSIEFSSSDSSIGTLEDEDDFDASAVSRVKMNFDGGLLPRSGSSTDVSDSLNSGCSEGGDGGGIAGNQEIAPVIAPAAPGQGKRPRGLSASAIVTSTDLGHGARLSGGDLSDGMESSDASGDGEKPLGPLLRQLREEALGRPGGPSCDPRPSSSPPSSGWGRSGNMDMKGSFKVEKIGASVDLVARRSRPRPRTSLSQSVMTHAEFKRRPRAQSKERKLGVRRALDLSGSTIVAYRGSLRSSTSSSEHLRDSTGDGSGAGAGGAGDGEDGEDEPDEDCFDEFKATVVLEQLIRAADVAALLQDWDNMLKWSTRLYKELKNGFLQGRGFNPSVEWYENQIKFLDFYILPLARNLAVMGVFAEGTGGRFARLVKRNLERWTHDGNRATEIMMKKDEAERGRERELRERKEWERVGRAEAHHEIEKERRLKEDDSERKREMELREKQEWERAEWLKEDEAERGRERELRERNEWEHVAHMKEDEAEQRRERFWRERQEWEGAARMKECESQRGSEFGRHDPHGWGRAACLKEDEVQRRRESERQEQLERDQVGSHSPCRMNKEVKSDLMGDGAAGGGKVAQEVPSQRLQGPRLAPQQQQQQRRRPQQEPEGDTMESLAARPRQAAQTAAKVSPRQRRHSPSPSLGGEDPEGDTIGSLTDLMSSGTYGQSPLLVASQHESLASSFKSLASSFNSVCTSSEASDNISSAIGSSGAITKNHGAGGGEQQQQRLPPARGLVTRVRSSRRLMHPRSLEVGDTCIVCGTLGRFNCPVCSAPYCSAKCCREHKALGCPNR